MKKSSYKKLKEENLILKRHIYMLVKFPEDSGTSKLIDIYQKRFDTEYDKISFLELIRLGNIHHDNICNELDCLILNKVAEDISNRKIPDPKQ